MQNDTYRPDDEEEPILELIQKIKDGDVDPKTLDKEARQACLEILMAEGYGGAQLGQIFKRCDKTIQRDITEIRRRNALVPSAEYAKEFVGDVVKKAFGHHDFLIRISNDRSASDSDKIEARKSAWNIMKDLVEKLQNLGYLPSRPQQVVGDIYHHGEGGDIKTYAELRKELKEVERIARDNSVFDEGTEQTIRLLEDKITKAELAQEIVDLKKKNNNEDKKEEDLQK
jgi:hypothetical protein